MRNESHTAPLRPRKSPTFFVMLAAGILAGGVQRERDVTLPHVYLERLEDESAAEEHRNGFTFEIANYLAQNNREGANVAPAIRQLADPNIRPDLIEEQLYFFAGMSGHGGSLSREEKRAIADVAHSWPDHFEPYFTTPGEHPDTRAELIRQLRDSNPPLQRYLPEEDPGSEIASRER